MHILTLQLDAIHYAYVTFIYQVVINISLKLENLGIILMYIFNIVQRIWT